jgi:hypothetical protein
MALKVWLTLTLATLGGLVFAQPTVNPYSLARHWAPVIHQGAASEQDFLTRVDYDGDWVGNNNWENLPTGDLSAWVYYSVIETETHWFIFYSLFHPRDYEPYCFPILCHENDLESIQLVVFKDGTQFGRLQVLETLAHSHIYLYRAASEVEGGFLRVLSEVIWEGGHPVVYVETYGHGIRGHEIELAGGEVIYRVGEEAEIPEGTDDPQVSYRLVPIWETLWPRRHLVGDGKLFDQPFDYRGRELPACLDGDDFGADRANAPWGYAQETGDRLSRGDWFLDPARALAYHATFPQPYSLHYLYNPYLAELGLLEGN